MQRVVVRFYEELNDFLPRDRRRRDLEIESRGRRSVKDLIESLGVPHVEVDLILVNGESVGFDRIVADGDRISVYPVFERLDITSVTRLRPEPLRTPRFVLDVHLRKLARRLRLLGFDVDYLPNRDDAELAAVAEAEDRILLSRDQRLMMRKNVSRGLWVRATDPELQVEEILDRLDLRALCRPFTRCVECNGIIEAVNDRDPEIGTRVPPGVLAWCSVYHRCRQCGRFYWKGSHYEKLRKRLEKIAAGGGVNLDGVD
ncbi:MAG: MoaD/ThiS family protein [Spirochaetes bacterium]|nr:MoaD/ThiS family protein [Spirochaetota bacterium]